MSCISDTSTGGLRSKAYFGFCSTAGIAGSTPAENTYVGFFQITNLMHNSFILQQYVCYTKILNMFRAARCSSSGGPIVSPQPLVSSLSVNSGTVCRLRADCSPLSTGILYSRLSDDTRGCNNTICPPEDEQGTARNMLRITL